MTAATTQPHPISAKCTAEEARALTDQIRGSVERTWGLLVAAYERRAWAALDYTSWQSYVTAEFGISRSRSYQLIDQAKVVREIADAAQVPVVDVTEAVARDIKPHLAEVTEQVRAAVADVPVPDRPAVVADVVRDAREQFIADRQTGEVVSAEEWVGTQAPGGGTPRPDAEPAPAPSPGAPNDWTPSSALDNPPPRPAGSRPASKPSAPATFEQDFATAAQALHKAVGQVERLSADARFAARVGRLDDKHRRFLLDAVEGLNLVLIRLRPAKP